MTAAAGVGAHRVKISTAQPRRDGTDAGVHAPTRPSGLRHLDAGVARRCEATRIPEELRGVPFT